jgi:mannitol 2-dehydrogenase
VLINLDGPRPLGRRTLSSLGTAVEVPAYDRSTLTPGVVHLGVGGFHRSHQAVYLDDLAALGETAWGEVGVSLRSPQMRDALAPQDFLFTVLERSAGGDRARVVGSLLDLLHAPDDPQAVVDLLADPRTRVVTLTITGGGYHLDRDGRLDAADPEVVADLGSPEVPTTAAWYLVEALDRRRRAGLPAFTVLSCDNVPDNGPAARAAVVGFAGLRDPALSDWIDAEASFPSSMVDRITPGTDDDARRVLADRFGLEDRWPVVAEPFTQWVVEDDFCNGRPPLERVGVHFVTDVTPYRLLKTRLLNASHSALGYLGTLAGGYRTSSEAMGNPVLADYLATLMREEVAPLLPLVPGIDVDAYQRSLLERFANPRTGDPLARLCGRGSTKMPAYLLPSLAEARAQGRGTTLLTLAAAAWICYLRGYGLDGAPLDVADALRHVLQPLAVAGGTDPRTLLAERSVFGDLVDDDELVEQLGWAVQDLEVYGVVATICDYLAADRPVAA